MAGVGAYLLYKGNIVCWISKEVQAVNPAQAEAKALLEGYNLLVQKAGGKGVVYSDSKETVAALSQKTPVISDWRSYEEIWKAWNMQSQQQQSLAVKHCSREHLNLLIAHRLATQGRLYRWQKTGVSEPVFNLLEML